MLRGVLLLLAFEAAAAFAPQRAPPPMRAVRGVRDEAAAAVAPTRAPTRMRVGRGGLATASATVDEEVDVVVVGSGLGGLSCASLLASRDLEVAVLEAHYEIGGCAHAFAVDLDGRTIPTAALAKQPDTPCFRFEAGPSLYSGLSPSASPNPLKHVFQMIGEEPEWITYDTWGAHLPEAPDGYELSIGAAQFKEILRRYYCHRVPRRRLSMPHRVAHVTRVGTAVLTRWGTGRNSPTHSVRSRRA